MRKNGALGRRARFQKDLYNKFKSYLDHGIDHYCQLKVIGGRIKVDSWAYNYRLRSVSGHKLFWKLSQCLVLELCKAW